MLRHRSALVLALVVAPLACAVAPEDRSRTKAVEQRATAELAKPMSSFARMVNGEWRMTARSGTSLFDAWHWGPGEHSMRVMTDGLDAAGNPWRELQTFYWHPGRKQVCLLGLSPFEQGVAQGTMTFDGELAEALVDMFQTGVHRTLVVRWAFDGPDTYRETLLERSNGADLVPLAEWDLVRVETNPAARSTDAAQAPKLSERLTVFERLLGPTWQVTGDEFDLRSTFEWVPYADGIYARTIVPTEDGEPIHLLDAYVYHHTGLGELRCLALSNRGGVYEGGVSVVEGGSLQLDFKGYEGDRAVERSMRVDFEKDGTLRGRLWSVDGVERTLVLDARHTTLAPTRD